jgi:dTDP-4-dehydrorhamnose reductase
VLITGAAGQVGRALLARVPADWQVYGLTHAQLDISDAAAVQAMVRELRPELIINAAAYTAVDKAESEPQRASAINAEGPRHLAIAAQALPGCRLLQISTDYVFDGRATQPYQPGDATHPLNVYGRTKLEGEAAVRSVLPERAVVLRTAWVYAGYGHNFLLTMLRLMRERTAVRVVADQHGTPTAAGSIALALWALAQRADIHGILHWTDAGSASWFEFAEAIATQAREAGLLTAAVQVAPIMSAEYPTAAARPRNSLLDIGASIELLGLTPPHWRTSLRNTLAVLAHS